MVKKIKQNARLKNRLKEICTARGIRLPELAEKIGKTPRALNMIARNEHVPTADTLVCLCDYLSCGVGELLYVEPPGNNISCKSLKTT